VTFGIFSGGITTTLDAEGVTVLGEGNGQNFGLDNHSGAEATLRGGSFTGRGGGETFGIFSDGITTTLDAEGVTALGEDGTAGNYGLWNASGAAATVRGGSFTARGGVDAFGILNLNSDTTIEAASVTVLAEDSSARNFGLYNLGGAVATLHGGSFTGRGGLETRGIENANASMLTAAGVTALGENGNNYNYGLGSYNGVTTTLRGGSFTARGGITDTYGIANGTNGATLEAESVTALGEDGNNDNYGLQSFSGGATTLRGGSFIGRGGINAHGIGNFDDGTTLDAASVTALGEGGSGYNFGLINGNGLTNATANVTQSVLEGATNSVLLDSGTVTVSNSRLAGNPVSDVVGTTICVLVTRDAIISTDGFSCP